MHAEVQQFVLPHLDGNVRGLDRKESVAVAVHNFIRGKRMPVEEHDRLSVQFASRVTDHVGQQGARESSQKSFI